MNKILLVFLGLAILLGGVLWFFPSLKDTVVSKSVESMDEVISVVENKDETDSRVKEVAGVQFSVPESFVKVDPSESRQSTDGSRGVTFRSADFESRKVSCEHYCNETDIGYGARLSVGFQPENLNSNLEDATAYAEFNYSSGSNCSNCIRSEIISIDSVPAILTVSSADGGGGNANASAFVNGEIFDVSLEYGYYETYEDYEDVFLSVLDSVEFD